MNFHPVLAFCLAAVPSAMFAEAPSRVPTRDAISHSELMEARAKAADPFDVMHELPPPAEDARPGERTPVSILESSEFLSYNGLGTLVPKGALLNVPATYKDRVRMAEGARIVPWSEFFRLNRGWLSTHEVTRKQAEAEQPLTEEALEALAKSSFVVVATLSSSPITVLRPPPLEEENTDAAVNQETTHHTKP